MKFNLDKIIPEVIEQYSHGKEIFGEVRVQAIKSIDVVTVTQNSQHIVMDEDQAFQLHKMLNQVFGGLN